MKKKIMAGVIVVMLMFGATGCASWDRAMKSVGSDVTGGLYRNVTVYSLDGSTKLAEYNGKIDVQESESKVFFDLNGKRTAIYNATVIVQEQ